MILPWLMEIFLRSVQLFTIAFFRWKKLRLKGIHFINPGLLKHFKIDLKRTNVLDTYILKLSFFTSAAKISSISHKKVAKRLYDGIRLKKLNLILKWLGGCSMIFWIRNLRNRIYKLYLNLVTRRCLIQHKLPNRFEDILPILCKSYRSFLSGNFLNSLIFEEISEQEVINLCSSLRSGTATGFDNVTMSLIK